MIESEKKRQWIVVNHRNTFIGIVTQRNLVNTLHNTEREGWSFVGFQKSQYNTCGELTMKDALHRLKAKYRYELRCYELVGKEVKYLDFVSFNTYKAPGVNKNE